MWWGILVVQHVAADVHGGMTSMILFYESFLLACRWRVVEWTWPV